MVAIGRYINTDYIERLSSLSRQGSNAGASVVSAMSGGGESRPAQAINAAVRLYTNAYTNMNYVGSMVNLARTDLEALRDLNGELMSLAQQAAKPGTSHNRRKNINDEFIKKAELFKVVLGQSSIGDNNYLELKGLKDSFKSMGLDSRSIQSVGKAFDQFHSSGPDGKLVDLSIKARERPLPPGTGMAKPAQSSEDLLSYKRGIGSRADAHMTLRDLQELDKQLSTNLVAVEGLTNILIENLDLVRRTAIIFSEIGSKITNITDAEQLARIVSQEIIQNARAAMKHVANLEPIAVAALTLEKSGLLEQ